MELSDVPKLTVHEHAILKKFDCSQRQWTQEEIDAGEADDDLVEILTLEDGELVDVWRRDG